MFNAKRNYLICNIFEIVSLILDCISVVTNEIPENAEFLPYHAAELSLQLECYHDIQEIIKLQENNNYLILKDDNNSNNNNNNNNNNNGNSSYKKIKKKLTYDEIMTELGCFDDPIIFFQEMSVVLQDSPNSLFGDKLNNDKIYLFGNNYSEFDKYLLNKWKDLKKYLKDVKETKCKDLYFYLPLLNFRQFLKNQEIAMQQREEYDQYES